MRYSSLTWLHSKVQLPALEHTRSCFFVRFATLLPGRFGVQ